MLNVEGEGAYLDLTPHGKLVHRFAARVVRLSANCFERVALTE